MTDSKSEYEFYVGPDTLLEGASLEINGTARIDGTIVGKVTVNHLIVRSEEHTSELQSQD